MDLRPYRVLFWIALYLLAVELALEVRATRRGWEAFLLGRESGWQADPDPRFGPDAEFPFRSLRVPRERTPGRARVWIASSSYAEDTQVAPDRIFPHLLSQNLERAGRPTEVLNASHAGLGILVNTRDLADLGPVWKPDLALLYQMSNDIDYLAERAAQVAAESGLPDLQEEFASIDAGQPSFVVRWVEEMTVYHHLKTHVTTRLTAARPLRNDIGPESEARLLSWVEGFVETARDVGARPVLCTFATSHRSGELDELPADFAQQLLAINVELSPEGWARTVERVNAGLVRLARERDLDLVDLASALRGHHELFRDFWHFTEEGHRRVAEVLAAELEPLLDEDVPLTAHPEARR